MGYTPRATWRARYRLILDRYSELIPQSVNVAGGPYSWGLQLGTTLILGAGRGFFRFWGFTVALGGLLWDTGPILKSAFLVNFRRLILEHINPYKK